MIYILLTAATIICGCSSCSESDEKQEYSEFSNLDLGKGTYRPNPFKFLDNVPPFSWMGMPDSVKKETELQISFNEDAIRSHSSAQLAFVDVNGNIINGISFDNSGNNSITLKADITPEFIPVAFTVNPAVGDTILSGSIVVLGNDLDQVNDETLASTSTPVASWSLTHRTGINWWRWIILILIIALIIATVIGIIYVVCQAAPYIGEALSSVSLPSLKLDIKRKDGKKKDKKDKKDKKSNDIIQYLLTLEQRLYSNLTICNKYDALEQMRIIIDDLYKDNMPVYLEAKNKLKHNTWGALEEAWKLWHPTPSSHVEWIGENNRICVLKTTHSLYCECKKLHFLECSYDDHGSPDLLQSLILIQL